MGERSLVFDRHQEGSKFYRIPAIVTMADGSLVAVADKRIDSNKDLPGNIDVVCRRSTDGGLTWSPMTTVVAHDADGGYGDPALVVVMTDDGAEELLCIMTHGQGLWESTDGDHARICTSRSADMGQTWSEPTDITAQVFGATGSDAKVKGIGTFATSGRALLMSNGRIMLGLVVRHNPKKWTPLAIYAMYSDDNGETWDITPTPISVQGDESKFVELADGTLICSIRSSVKGQCRLFSRSTDGGATWSDPVEVADIVGPRCNGDIIAAEISGKEVLLHTIPYGRDARSDVSILASEDGGETWENLITVCPTGSAYSSITQLPDGSLGILTEEACSEGGHRLWYSHILLTDK